MMNTKKTLYPIDPLKQIDLTDASRVSEILRDLTDKLNISPKVLINDYKLTR